MASTFPYVQDVFTSVVDGIDYETAAEYNALANAILAIEATIGLGAVSTPANILYSAAFGDTFPTLAARLSFSEGVVAGSTSLDEAAGDITISNFGDLQQAGGSGKAADAKHRHGRENLSTTAPQAVGQIAIPGSSGKGTDAAHVHQGVASLAVGTGLGLSGGDGSGHGALTLTNTGVQSIGAGAGIGSTGGSNPTLSVSGLRSITTGYGLGSTGGSTPTLSASLNTAETSLGGPLNISAYGPTQVLSMALAAGTWFVWFKMLVGVPLPIPTLQQVVAYLTAGGSNNFVGDIWIPVIDVGNQSATLQSLSGGFPLSLGSTTTISLMLELSSTTQVTLYGNAEGFNCTYITALRVE